MQKISKLLLLIKSNKNTEAWHNLFSKFFFENSEVFWYFDKLILYSNRTCTKMYSGSKHMMHGLYYMYVMSFLYEAYAEKMLYTFHRFSDFKIMLVLFKTQMSNLVCTTSFWNNLHQVHLYTQNLKIGKQNYLKFWEQ